MIDTHAVFKRLQAAGLDERQAEAFVDLVVDFSTDRLDKQAAFKRMQAAGMAERLAEAVVDVAMQAYAVRGAVQGRA